LNSLFALHVVFSLLALLVALTLLAVSNWIGQHDLETARRFRIAGWSFATLCMFLYFSCLSATLALSFLFVDLILSLSVSILSLGGVSGLYLGFALSINIHYGKELIPIFAIPAPKALSEDIKIQQKLVDVVVSQPSTHHI
jgi:hypothetical protein